MSILKELEDSLPKDADITDIKFEASDLVLYTKSKDFFVNGEPTIREIVSKLKKRIELRPDITITMDVEKAKKRITELSPEEAGIQDIYFEPELGKVIIECLKPGLVIGKGGELYRTIKNDIFWLPKIERAPAIRSPVVSAIRSLLHTELDYRKKFLNKIGQKLSVRKEIEDEWVRVSFLGAARHIGASCVILQTENSRIVLDFGMNPATGFPPQIDAPEFDLEKIDAVILSHAHLDHSAFVPYIYDQGFTGPLYCTPPTRDLSVLLCMDYIDLAHREGKKVWYSKSALEKMVKHTIALDFGEVSDITQDIRLTFHPSGHILGSALSHLHIGKGLHNLVYTGDMKFVHTRLLEPAFTNFKRIETLIIESTYGSPTDIMPNRRDAERELLDSIHKTMERGGKVLIPSFAVGRAQEAMAILAEADFKYPIWIEGMISAATAIHTVYPEYLSKGLQREIFHRGNNPFISDKFTYVAPKERDKVIDSSEPGVILATSGMLIGGPIMEYLKGLAHDKRSTLLFIGYQGEGTQGRRIQGGWRQLNTSENGRTKTINIEMEIKTIGGLSGHADRNELIGFIRRLRSKPNLIITNHGDRNSCIDLARDARRYFKVESAAPKVLEAIRLR